MNIQKYRLSTMFSIMFAVAFILISALFYYFNYTKQVANLESNLKSQARSVLDFADVLLDSRNEKFFSGQSSEVPQIIQNSVFDKFTKVSGGKVFFKEASKTPTDPKNLATKYEKETIDSFIKNRKLKELDRVIKKDGKDYYILSRPIISEKRCIMCHPTWKPGNVIAIEDVMIDMKDFNKAINSSALLTALATLVNIIIILLLIRYIFNKYVSSRINKLLQVIFRVEKGNFVIDDLLKGEALKQGSSKNEIDRLFRHLNRMVKSLQPVIANVVESSKNMAFQSSFGYTKVDETDQHVKNQNALLVESKQLLQNVLDENNKMRTNLDELLDSSKSSLETISRSKEDINKNLSSGENAIVSMDNTSTTISDLKTFSKEVSKMTGIITDIADETNLIALNAAIEAARAGVHGRSFSVVADKIRELAEVSLENAQDISTILTKIDTQIESVSKSAQNSKQSVVNLVDSSQDIEESFEKIQDSFNLISNSLTSFDSDFMNESGILKQADTNLVGVEKASTLLVENAKSSKKLMGLIARKSGELKTLADGFEIVLNKRTTDRTVQVPPLLALDEKNNKTFIFDLSDKGLSFYYLYDDRKLQHGDAVTLKIEKSNKIIKAKVVYSNNSIIKDTYFYGAEKI